MPSRAEREIHESVHGRRYPAKSWTALRWTCERVKPRYMWTFTLRDVHTAQDGARLWSALWRDVLKRMGFRGVRVFELHPGGHGLHVHFLCDSFYSVRVVRARMRSLASGAPWGTGFGVDVTRITGARGWLYACKYVSKGLRTVALKGVRLWARCACDGYRVREVDVSTSLGRSVRRVQEIVGASFHNMRAAFCLWARVGERGVRLYCRWIARARDRGRAREIMQRWSAGFLPGMACA